MSFSPSRRAAAGRGNAARTPSAVPSPPPGPHSHSRPHRHRPAAGAGWVHAPWPHRSGAAPPAGRRDRGGGVRESREKREPALTFGQLSSRTTDVKVRAAFPGEASPFLTEWASRGETRPYRSRGLGPPSLAISPAQRKGRPSPGTALEAPWGQGLGSPWQDKAQREKNTLEYGCTARLRHQSSL